MRPRSRLAVAILAAVLTVSLPAGSRAVGGEPSATVFAAAPPDDAVQDVLVLAEARPLFVRFQIQVAGEGFRAVWSQFVGRLYSFLDGDDNRVLTLQEAQRGSWQQLLSEALTDGETAPAPGGASAPEALHSQPRDGVVSRHELARYLRFRFGCTEFGIQPGLSSDPRAEALFALLDADQDGALSGPELAPAATDALLARLDVDEDELISLTEIRPFENANAVRYLPSFSPQITGIGRGDGLVVPLGPGGARGSGLVDRLIARYDRGTASDPRDGRLSLAELGGAAGTLRRFDADRDGMLSPAELTALLGRPVPDIVLEVALVPPGNARPMVGLVPAGNAPAPRSDLAITADPATGSVTVTLPGVALEFAVEDNFDTKEAEFERQFNLADGDRNGYLERSEAAPNYSLRGAFDVADRNRDRKVSRAELTAYVTQQTWATGTRVLLTLGDRGRALFDMLDTDGDHKLSVRELRGVGARMADLDRDRDRRIVWNEVPHLYRLCIGRGPASRRCANVDFYDGSDPPRRRKGPLWFNKMDTNRDGDISRSEFLGTPLQFRGLDTDGDGLIDPREAEGRR